MLDATVPQSIAVLNAQCRNKYMQNFTVSIGLKANTDNLHIESLSEPFPGQDQMLEATPAKLLGTISVSQRREALALGE